MQIKQHRPATTFQAARGIASRDLKTLGMYAHTQVKQWLYSSLSSLSDQFSGELMLLL